MDDAGHYFGIRRRAGSQAAGGSNGEERLGQVALRVIVIVGGAVVTTQLLDDETHGWGLLAFLLAIVVFAAIWGLLVRVLGRRS
jgi:hypothetical protein